MNCLVIVVTLFYLRKICERVYFADFFEALVLCEKNNKMLGKTCENPTLKAREEDILW